MKKMIEKVYNDLYNYFENQFYHVHISQLVDNNDKDIIKYGTYTPYEILMEYKLFVMYNNGQISDELYKFLVNNIELLLTDKIKYRINSVHSLTDVCRMEFKELLDSNKLPINFNINDIVELSCERVSGNNFGQFDVCKRFRLLSEIADKLFIETKLREILSFKDLGQYGKYTPIEFLNIYKLELISNIDDKTKEGLVLVYDWLLKTNDKIAECRDELAISTLVTNQKEYESELSKYNLPIIFDLGVIIDSYGKDKTRSIQKVR